MTLKLIKTIEHTINKPEEGKKMKKIIISQILFLITVGFTFQAQAVTPETPSPEEMREEMQILLKNIIYQDSDYKFVNLTDHRALVTYESIQPFLQKGHEVKPGECLYIHKDYFNYLSIFLHIKGATQTLCHYKGTTICEPTDYTLTHPPDVTEADAAPDPSIVKELSYSETWQTPETEDTPAIQWSKIHRFIFMKKRTDTTEECGVF